MKAQGRALILAIVLTWAFSASADWTNSQIRDATVEACQRISLKDLRNPSSRLWLQPGGCCRIPSERFMRLMNSVARSALAATFEARYVSNAWTAHMVLYSEGYREALRACYGDDPEVKALFDQIVESFDRKGKAAGVFTQVGSLVTGASLFAFLPKAVAAGANLVGLGAATYFTRESIVTAMQMNRAIGRCQESTGLSAELCQGEMAMAKVTDLKKSLNISDMEEALEKTKIHTRGEIAALEAELSSATDVEWREKLEKALAIHRGTLKRLNGPRN